MKSIFPLLLASLFLSTAWSADTAVSIFPKPDPVGTYMEMKLPATDGQVWRQPVEDWVGARERVANDPEWSEWFSEQKTEIDDWIAHRQDRVEWVAGWWHEFISPKDSSFLIWQPEIPGEETQTLMSATDPQVPVSSKIFRAWIVIFRAKHMSMVLKAAMLWRLTGEQHYADWVESQLDFYANNLEQWPIQTRFYGPSRLFGQPLTDASNITKLSNAVRLIWDRVEPDRRQFWFDKLFKPEALMLNQSMKRIHNIACWLRSSTAQIALLYDDKELWDSSIDGPWGIRRQIENGVTSDYIWYEQSSGYNQFTLRALAPLFLSAGLLGRAEEFSREIAIVQNMALAPTWLRFPDNSIPNPADTTVNYPHYAPLDRILQSIYRVMPTPIGLYEAAKIKNWDTLLDPPPAILPELPPLPVVTSHDYHSTRFGIMRSGDWQVFFHYGQLTGSHSQAELLNFEAHYKLTDVTHDSYTVGYGSPMHGEYFIRGLAHNVPLLNGDGSQKPPRRVGPLELPQRGKLLKFDPEIAVMSAAQLAYQKNAGAVRTLRIEGNRLIDEVTLTSHAEEPQTIGLALHVQGRVERPGGWQIEKDFGVGRSAAYSYWQEVQSAVCQDEVSFNVTFLSGVVMRLTFSTPGEFRIYLGSAPDSPVPARCDSFYLETEGRQATFKTEFVPLKPAASDEKISAGT
jgi:hypothetical protein